MLVNFWFKQPGWENVQGREDRRQKAGDRRLPSLYSQAIAGIAWIRHPAFLSAVSWNKTAKKNIELSRTLPFRISEGQAEPLSP